MVISPRVIIDRTCNISASYRIIVDYLAYRENKQRLNRYLRKNNQKIVHVEQVLDMLRAISGDKRFDVIKNQYINSENKEERDSMCLLLDMCEEEGIKKGRKNGIQEGRQKGIKEGISLAKQVIRLDASGKKANEIAKELDVELGIVKSILV